MISFCMASVSDRYWSPIALLFHSWPRS